MAQTHKRDGLTFIKGQVSVDATAGINVEGMDMVEFQIAGSATITYTDLSTNTYVVPNAGTRVGLTGSNVKTITFAGNISYS